MTRSNIYPDQQPDPEEVGTTLARLRELKVMLNNCITDLATMQQIGGTPEDYHAAKKAITLRIEKITAEMTAVRTWLIREGVLSGGGS